MRYAQIVKNELNYDFEVAEDLCKKTGLKFHHGFAEKADNYFKAANLSQHQVDLMLRVHTHIIANIFDRKKYPWYARIGIALYFLNFLWLFKRINSDAR